MVRRFQKEETSDTSIENMRNNLRESKENKIIKKERRNSLKKQSCIIEKTKNILKHKNRTIKMQVTMISRRRQLLDSSTNTSMDRKSQLSLFKIGVNMKMLFLLDKNWQRIM